MACHATCHLFFKHIVCDEELSDCVRAIDFEALTCGGVLLDESEVVKCSGVRSPQASECRYRGLRNIITKSSGTVETVGDTTHVSRGPNRHFFP
jgi:hypothetical protein